MAAVATGERLRVIASAGGTAPKLPRVDGDWKVVAAHVSLLP
jgi:hypothetical protein